MFNATLRLSAGTIVVKLVQSRVYDSLALYKYDDFRRL